MAGKSKAYKKVIRAIWDVANNTAFDYRTRARQLREIHLAATNARELVLQRHEQQKSPETGHTR